MAAITTKNKNKSPIHSNTKIMKKIPKYNFTIFIQLYKKKETIKFITYGL